MIALPAETETIVIGGGTAGGVCAGLLAEHGAESVLLLEAGPDYGPLSEGRWPAELLDARYVPLSHDWGLDSGSALPGRVLDFPRARVMGGCSAHNGCTAALGGAASSVAVSPSSSCRRAPGGSTRSPVAVTKSPL